jgi:hypothetical protein
VEIDHSSEWLIQHGAAPRQTVDSDSADALDLAIRMQSWKLADPLMRHPEMDSPSRRIRL